MLHFGSQITVKALKQGEIVDLIIIYRLGINYNKKVAGMHRLTIDFNLPQTSIEDFGTFSLPDAINIVMEKVTDSH